MTRRSLPGTAMMLKLPSSPVVVATPLFFTRTVAPEIPWPFSSNTVPLMRAGAIVGAVAVRGLRGDFWARAGVVARRQQKNK